MSTAVVEPKKSETKLNQLDQLKKFTKVVADTADFESIKEFKPQDATTNPSLVYAATQKQEYAHLLDEVLTDRKKSGLNGAAQIENIVDHLLVQFGCEILKIVPGRVSTETDARLSFDVEGSIKKARQLVKLYEERKIPRERVLIKVASTWEGINAADEIYTYYKKFDYKTEVMGASFRNVGQIIELAGCDLLTISPELMKELSESYEPVERKLDPEKAETANVERLELDEKRFRYLVNDNAMATEKTAEGIRKFAADVVKLEKFVASKL